MNPDYDFEIGQVIKVIKQEKPKTVLLQLPAGLKQYSHEIQKAIEESTDAAVLIWANSNFGACDLQQEIPGIDMLIHFGHNKFIKTF